MEFGWSPSGTEGNAEGFTASQLLSATATVQQRRIPGVQQLYTFRLCYIHLCRVYNPIGCWLAITHQKMGNQHLSIALAKPTGKRDTRNFLKHTQWERYCRQKMRISRCGMFYSCTRKLRLLHALCFFIVCKVVLHHIECGCSAALSIEESSGWVGCLVLAIAFRCLVMEFLAFHENRVFWHCAGQFQTFCVSHQICISRVTTDVVCK